MSRIIGTVAADFGGSVRDCAVIVGDTGELLLLDGGPAL